MVRVKWAHCVKPGGTAGSIYDPVPAKLFCRDRFFVVCPEKKGSVPHEKKHLPPPRRPDDPDACRLRRSARPDRGAAERRRKDGLHRRHLQLCRRRLPQPDHRQHPRPARGAEHRRGQLHDPRGQLQPRRERDEPDHHQLPRPEGRPHGRCGDAGRPGHAGCHRGQSRPGRVRRRVRPGRGEAGGLA